MGSFHPGDREDFRGPWNLGHTLSRECAKEARMEPRKEGKKTPIVLNGGGVE